MKCLEQAETESRSLVVPRAQGKGLVRVKEHRHSAWRDGISDENSCLSVCRPNTWLAHLQTASLMLVTSDVVKTRECGVEGPSVYV